MAKSSMQRSPLAPTKSGSSPSGVPFSGSAPVKKGTLRPKQSGVGASDSALGQVAPRARKATTAGAQYRISTGLPGPESPEARATQANGRIIPAVMGSRQRQNFDMQQGALY